MQLYIFVDCSVILSTTSQASTTVYDVTTLNVFLNKTEMERHNNTETNQQTSVNQYTIIFSICGVLCTLVLIFGMIIIYHKKCRNKQQIRSPIYIGKFNEEFELKTYNCSHI